MFTTARAWTLILFCNTPRLLKQNNNDKHVFVILAVHLKTNNIELFFSMNFCFNCYRCRKKIILKIISLTDEK